MKKLTPKQQVTLGHNRIDWRKREQETKRRIRDADTKRKPKRK